MKKLLFIIIAILMFLPLAITAQAEKLEIAIFTRPSCTHCQKFKREYLQDLKRDFANEKKLVERNNLSEVVFYKAGHHGSNTSSNACLIDIIKPQIVAINCVAGGQYDFPKQNAINRIAKYTDRVYVTREVGGKLLNGTIIITSTADGVSVNCLNNQTLFKDTAWFNENRDLPNTWKNIA